MPISDFKELFSIERLPRENEGGYYTLAGFIMTQLGQLTAISDHFVWNNLRIEVIDMDRRRIDKVLVSRVEPGAVEDPGSAFAK
jgi:putative hemolysin